MERSKNLLIVLVCCIAFSFHSQAQNNPQIYQAFITGNMKLWKTTLDQLEAAPHKSEKECLDLINYYYGYIGWSLGRKGSKKDVQKLMKTMETHLETLDKKNYAPSMVYFYKSALIGFEIGLHNYKAPLIGKKSLDFADQAIKEDPQNPFAYLQVGNITYYTPPIVGGSKQKALEKYLQALSLAEAGKWQIKQNWNYLNLLATLINTYYELEEYQKAAEFCQKTLQAEPGFEWVKNTLYPQTLKNQSISYEE